MEWPACQLDLAQSPQEAHMALKGFGLSLQAGPAPRQLQVSSVTAGTTALCARLPEGAQG